MSLARRKWDELSVRYKVMIWSGMILVVLFSIIVLSVVWHKLTLDELSLLQQDNTYCYRVQEAIKEEQKAFETLIREDSKENQQSFLLACATTRRCMEVLPFEYHEIGIERYARTWNLLHGYEGYSEYRDRVVQAEPETEGYTEQFYLVMEMQDNLAMYALRLAQATLEHGTQVYERGLQLYQILPGIGFLVILFIIFEVVVMLRLLNRSLVQPILQLSAESRKIAENDFSGDDLESTNRDELGELVRTFQRMKYSMKEHIDTLEEKKRISDALHQEKLGKLELEQTLDRTRLEMLKSQVNPHFLFNTLNMISCMAKLEDADDTNRMILALSNLFRYNLRTKKQEVYLEQELEALDDYIHIQKMRFDSRIQFHKIIEVDAYQVKIPSFTLQPVVENAFVHGLSNREEGGRIVLRIWESERGVVVSVADNGIGIGTSELSSLHQRIRDSENTGCGIGLGNISRRISMMYPNGSVHIYSKLGYGTVIQCVIPQKESKRDDI